MATKLTMDDLVMKLDQMSHEHHLLYLEAHRHLPPKEEEEPPRFVCGDKVCWEMFGNKKWHFGVVIRERPDQGVVDVWEYASYCRTEEKQEPTRTKGLVTVRKLYEPEFNSPLGEAKELKKEQVKLYDPQIDYC